MKKKLKLKKIKFIPVNVPKIFKQDKINVKDCLDKNWISSEGSYVKIFEKNFSKYNDRKYAIAVSSGTAALEVALKALNLKPKDEVIIPTFSIISTALCIVKLGLKPVLVDSDMSTWNMNPQKVIKKISKKTKAIIITHIYGFPVDMDKIIKITKIKNIKIIEDSAEMIGQKYKKRKCGSFGDISTFSFYANKHITTGEGGMILTNNKELYEKCRSLRNLCFGTNNNRFVHDDIGWNYRLTNIQAAIGCGQLKNISWIIKRKREIGKRYHALLKSNDKIIIQPIKNSFSKNIFWVFGVLIKEKTKNKRDIVMKQLMRKKIQTRTFFYPMHKQKIFKKMKFFSNKEKYPNAEYLSLNGFYLPSGLGIKNYEIDYICETLNKILLN
jgi:perosamine synthetase